MILANFGIDHSTYEKEKIFTPQGTHRHKIAVFTALS